MYLTYIKKRKPIQIKYSAEHLELKNRLNLPHSEKRRNNSCRKNTLFVEYFTGMWGNDAVLFSLCVLECRAAEAWMGLKT